MLPQCQLVVRVQGQVQLAHRPYFEHEACRRLQRYACEHVVVPSLALSNMRAKSVTLAGIGMSKKSAMWL